MNGYSVSIKETSKELTAKQRIALKDTTNAIKLDEATQVEDVFINVDMYAVLVMAMDILVSCNVQSVMVMAGSIVRLAMKQAI